MGQWYFRSLIEGVLGVEATLEGLRVPGALPEGWDGYRLMRPFRGAVYDIAVWRARADEVPGVLVNGELWDGSLADGVVLPLPDGQTEMQVAVLIR